MTLPKSPPVPPRPAPAPGTVATDVLANKRLGKLYTAITRLEEALAECGMTDPAGPLVMTVDERDGLWLEVIAIKYMGRSAHIDAEGRELTPMADGMIRRFRIGMVEFRYRSTIESADLERMLGRGNG
jgi:hypothetical protein